MLNVDASKILDKEMNRKQFLRNVGVGVIALTGITAALRAFSQQAPSATSDKAQSTHQATAGYGNSVYGGVKPRA